MLANIAPKVWLDQRLTRARIAQPLDNRRLQLGVECQHRQPLTRRADPSDNQPAQIGANQFDQPVTVRLGDSSGPLLVSAGTTQPLAMTTAADGTIGFTLAGNAVSVSAGALAGQAQGLIAVRDRKADLDTIANALIATVNAAQASGVALDGTPGQPLFSGSGAAGITLALTGGSGLATAPAGATAGSRDPANLTALRNALDAVKITGQLDGLLFSVSSATAARRTTADALDSIASAARLTLAEQAGVSLDDEAANLVRFQQAFQASGKVIQVASDLFDTLLAIR